MKEILAQDAATVAQHPHKADNGSHLVNGYAEKSDSTYRFSLFNHKNDNQPKQKIGTWPELCELLTQHDIRAVKDGPLISAASYPQGKTRAKENVEAVSLLALDFDNTARLGEIESSISSLNNGRGAAAVIYSTYSHDPKNGIEKYRVIVPFSTSVPGIESVYLGIWTRANFAFQSKADPSAKDASRMHYLASCREEHSKYAVAKVYDGPPLDPETLPPLPERALSPTVSVINGASDNYASKVLENQVARVFTAGEGDRNNTLNKAALQIGHFTGASRIDRATAESALEAAAVAIGLKQDEARATIRSGLNKGEQEPSYKGTPRQGFEGFEGFEKPVDTKIPNFESSPKALTSSLRSVPAFQEEMLPHSLREWVKDAAERISCPPDFLAIPAVIALASLIGRTVCIRPKKYDDWEVVPNLWGAVIARPGAKKSPAASEAFRHLDRLQADAIERYNEKTAVAAANAEINDALRAAIENRIKAAAKKGNTSRAALELIQSEKDGIEDIDVSLKRYLVNDTTVEALGEILKANPRGILTNRDELTGWLNGLDKQGRETDKAFYLEAFNGTKTNFIYDRIGRGRLIIPHVCVSVFGTIQPGPMGQIIRAVSTDRKQRDGFVSRFQLLVYPDNKPYKRVDRYPDNEAKNRAYQVYESLDNLDPYIIGAQQDEGKGLAYLRFDNDAQYLFDKWLDNLEEKLSGQKETTLLEEHLAKYRSLMPSLALVFHLANIVDGVSQSGLVTHMATLQAAVWCDYLEAHARRIYGQSFDGDTETIERLGERLGDLSNPFTLRDVHQKKWAGLTEKEEVERVLERLIEKEWIKPQSVLPDPSKGGRPTVKFWINPVLIKVRDK